MTSTKVIAITGASGAGKSYLATALVAALAEAAPTKSVASMSLDAYYRDLSHLKFSDRQQVNFDHPNALDLNLFATQLSELRAGRGVNAPRYDFNNHTRHSDAYFQSATDFLVVDGLLLTAHAALSELYDLLIYIDTDLKICFQRRLQRDVKERGRTPASVADFWQGRALPMFAQFGAAAAGEADLVLPGVLPVNGLVNRILTVLGLDSGDSRSLPSSR